MKRRLGVLFVGLMTVSLSACNSEVEETEPPRDVPLHIKEMAEPFLEGLPTDSDQYKILQDAYVTDVELQQAYDSLLNCLKPLDIVPGWDTSFASDANYGPDISSQAKAINPGDPLDVQNAAIDELDASYLECEEKTTRGVVAVYKEQVRSTDGRSHYTRMREHLVSCGFTEYADYSDDRMDAEWYGRLEAGDQEYTECMNNFLMAEAELGP